jgi:hypothetical protein
MTISLFNAFKTSQIKYMLRPVVPTDGDTSDSDEFYLQLQEQIDRVPGRNVMLALGDFNAQVGRNRDR